MRGRGIAAGVLAVCLWPQPAPAWAPRKPSPAKGVEEPAVSEAPVQDEPPASEPLTDEPMPSDEATPGDEAVPSDEAAPTDADAQTPTSPSADAQSTAASTPRKSAATHDVPADDFETEPGLAPGGYHGHGVILERPPPDGRNQIIVGTILVPLGTIATVTSAVGTWLTVPQHCASRLASVGIEADSARCQGLFAFNVVRVSYGALMLVSGATILALGMIKRERYRKWRHEHGMQARIQLGPGSLRLRF